MSPKSVFVEKVSLAELVFDGELSAAELAADTADDEKLNDGLLMVGMLISILLSAPLRIFWYILVIKMVQMLMISL